MSYIEHTSRAEQVSVLSLAAEIQNLQHLVQTESLEHDLMVVGKWLPEEGFLLEAAVYATDSSNSDLQDETASDLNVSYLVLDEEDLNLVFESMLETVPSLAQISEDTQYDIFARAFHVFQEMQQHVKGSSGILRLGMNLVFTVDSVELSCWTAFVVQGIGSSDDMSVVEEHHWFGHHDKLIEEASEAEVRD